MKNRYIMNLLSLFDAKKLKRKLELRRDYIHTKASIGNFIGTGNNCEIQNEHLAVFSFTNVPFKAKFYALLAKRMQMEGFSPIIIERKSHKDIKPYFNLFGFQKYVEWEDLTSQEDITSRASQYVKETFPKSLSTKSIMLLKFGDIPVGRYALSSACRALKRFPQDLNEDTFRRVFERKFSESITSILAAQKFFDEHSIRKILLRDIGYVPAGPILDVALQRGIDCLVVANSQRRGTWIFKRYTQLNRYEHEFSISQYAWEQIYKLPFTDKMNQDIEKELAGRYATNSDLDTRRLQEGKKVMSPNEVFQALQLDPNKKTAVVFAHVSWDGAFFFGEDLFETFDEWLFETTRHAISNPNINWIIKLHPLNILHFALEGKKKFTESEIEYLEKLEPLPQHVQILHSDTLINTFSLFPIIDYGITVRGTIGLELPCFGIPVLTAGTGRYEGRGFTVDAKTKEEYFERLANLEQIPRLSDEQQKLARTHYYHLMVKRQVSFEDIAPMQVKQANEADTRSYNNIRIRAASLDDLKRSHSLRLFVHWATRSKDFDFFEEDKPE